MLTIFDAKNIPPDAFGIYMSVFRILAGHLFHIKVEVAWFKVLKKDLGMKIGIA